MGGGGGYFLFDNPTGLYPNPTGLFKSLLDLIRPKISIKNNLFVVQFKYEGYRQ